MLSIENLYSILAKNGEKYLKTSNFRFISKGENDIDYYFRFSGFTEDEKDRFESEIL